MKRTDIVYDDCCDTGSDNLAFIKRTLAILKQYEGLVNYKKLTGQHVTSYSRTLYINCCIGLLFIPREKIYKEEFLNSPAKEWGINTADYCHAKGKYSDIPIKDLMRHLRNSLAHGNFASNYNSRNELASLSFKDYDNKEKRKLSFSGTMAYNDFKTLVYLLAAHTLEQNK